MKTMQPTNLKHNITLVYYINKSFHKVGCNGQLVQFIAYNINWITTATARGLQLWKLVQHDQFSTESNDIICCQAAIHHWDKVV